MEEAQDLQEVALVAEKDAVVLGAETEQGWMYDSQLLYVALARVRIACERFEYLQGNRLVNVAQVGPSVFRLNNALSHCGAGVVPARFPRPSFPNRPGSGRNPPESLHAGWAGEA